MCLKQEKIRPNMEIISSHYNKKQQKTVSITLMEAGYDEVIKKIHKWKRKPKLIHNLNQEIKRKESTN